MILEFGPVEKLKGMNWVALELRSERTIEPTMRRVGNKISGIFRNDPIEIFIPITKRDLDIFEMGTMNLIFARSTNLNALFRLMTVTGVVQFLTEGETKRHKAIEISDDYVQGLIIEAEKLYETLGEGIEVGSFVRILNGEMRDFCGTVEVIDAGRAIIRISLKTKTCLNETPVKNLLNLSQVPKEQRVWYYGSLVDQLVADKDADGLALIAEDLPNGKTEETISEFPEFFEATDEAKRHTRQRTVTAFVKKLILLDKIHEPMEIAKKVVAALKTGDIKAPKNIFIGYCIIKDNLMKLYFKNIDPTLNNYRDVIHKYGRKYKFSAQDIFNLDLSLGIPIQSQEICKDGRSREARMKASKQALKKQAKVKVKIAVS